MISIDSFLRGIEEEFPEIKPGSLQPASTMETVIEWNSLNALILITKVEQMTGTKLQVKATKETASFQELYQLATNTGQL